MSKHSSEDRTVLAYRDTGLRYLCSAQIVATAESRSITRHDGTQSHARSVRAVTRSCASPTGLTDAVVAMLALIPPPITRAAALRKMGLAGVTAPEFDTLRANLTRAQTQLRTETQNRRGFKLKAAVREVDAAATALVDAQNIEIVRLRMIASQQYAAGYRRARAFSTD